jgi:hypothetical protein
MRSRLVPSVLLACALVAAAAAVALLRPAPAAAGGDDDGFEGFLVEQAGEVRRYPQADGWEGIADLQSFSLERRGLRISFYGDFVVEERKDAKRQDPPPSSLKVGTGITVVHGGTTRHFRSEEGWSGSRNVGGVFLRRRGQTLWFYGTMRYEEPR